MLWLLADDHVGALCLILLCCASSICPGVRLHFIAVAQMTNTSEEAGLHLLCLSVFMDCMAAHRTEAKPNTFLLMMAGS